jgi:hypothetical protein
MIEAYNLVSSSYQQQREILNITLSGRKQVAKYHIKSESIFIKLKNNQK